MEMLKSWREDPFRSALNERGASEDATGFRLAGRLLMAYSLLFLLLQERMPGLAAVNGVYALLLEALSAAILQHRRLYVQCREPVVLLAQALQACVLVYSVAHDGSRAFEMHKGCRFRLLALLLAGAPFFMAVTTLHARLLLSWNVWALPLLALLPLSAGDRVCGRLLESPGIGAPLAELFQLLEAVHVARSPVAALVLREPDTPLPLQACLAINTWALALCTVVLPLCILYPQERRARRRFWEELAAQMEASNARMPNGPARPQAAPVVQHARAAAAQQALLPPFPLTGLWALDAYLYSSLIWGLAAAMLNPSVPAG